MPNQFDLMWPTLQALKDLGGSARISEIVEQVIAAEGFTEAQQSVKRRPGDHMSMIEYRLAWARNGLKLIGAIENSARGVWSITEEGRVFASADDAITRIKRWRSEYNRAYLEQKRELAEEDDGTELTPDDVVEATIASEVEPKWQDQLLDRLMALSPAGFERLTQRLLREAGFRDVTVLGKVSDGGLDGVGVLRVSLVSFPVYFQCKRYRDSVGASAVRDFRGAMAGRGEKGLLITTGTFTREARQEANRDGAPPVELISGEELTNLLRQYELGVITTQRIVEDIAMHPPFFDQFE